MHVARRIPDMATGQSILLVSLEAIALALTLMLAWIGSSAVPSAGWSILAMVNYFWLITLLFRVEPRATILLAPELVVRLSSMISFIFIESGGRIPELGSVGDAGPYSSSYLCYSALYCFIVVGLFRLIVGAPGRLRAGPLADILDQYSNLLAAAIIGLVALLILWLLVRGIETGFPLLTGTDRYQYRQQSGDKIINYSLNSKSVFLLILGLVVFQLPVKAVIKGLAALSAITLLAIAFLFADKFFTQLNGALAFFTPLLILRPALIRRNVFKLVLSTVAILAPVFTVTWYIYSGNGAMTTAATIDKLSGRLVGQGELWWVQLKTGSPLVAFNKEFIGKNISVLGNKDNTLIALQNGLGPNYYSNLYAPGPLRASGMRKAGTVTYTAATEPLGLMAFGWIGLAVALALCGGLLALLIAYLAYAIINRSAPSCFFATYLLGNFRAFFAQGTPWTLVGLPVLKWTAIVLAIELAMYLVARTQYRGDRRSPKTKAW